MSEHDHDGRSREPLHRLLTQPSMTRADFLKLVGTGLGALAAGGLLAACTAPGSGGAVASHKSEAEGVTGPFSWKRAQGSHLRLLLNKHPYQEALIAQLRRFTELTGITVSYDVFPEQNYFDKVTVDLSSSHASYDVFMTGAYQTWQYGPPGWIEDLAPWIKNPSATHADYDWEDFIPSLRQGDSWDFKVGDKLGSGGQWAIPMGFETYAVMYQKDIFQKYGLKPPTTLPELYDIAKFIKAHEPGMAGIETRGSKNWATIHPGYMSTYAAYGAKDYEVSSGKLIPLMNSTKAKEMTDLWMKMVREAGPVGWTTYTWYEAGSDFGARKGAILYDADILGYFQDVPGGSASAGNVAWAPTLKGPSGKRTSNVWIWSLAIPATSKNKVAAWLLIQWATSKDYLTTAALQYDQVDPVRQSIWNNPQFKDKLSGHTNFYETFQENIKNARILFTPQPKFFETTTEWAGTLETIFGGTPTSEAMDALVSELRGMLKQAGLA